MSSKRKPGDFKPSQWVRWTKTGEIGEVVKYETDIAFFVYVRLVGRQASGFYPDELEHLEVLPQEMLP